MRELGAAEGVWVRLDVGYRCPPPVANLARAVLERRAPMSLPSLRSRGHAAIVGFASEHELVEAVGTELRSIRRKDPRGSVAVLCRSPQNAGRFAMALKAYVPLRLVYQGRFLPGRSVEVTTVDEAKGLEFDYVVVPDASDVDYPDAPVARRAMYVAITRARYEVVVAYAGARSAILPDSA
jgi:DNA helicase IV